MRYLAININEKLDQDWYYRCNSVLECYNYFDRLGSSHGPRVAIFDLEQNDFLWVDAAHLDKIERINGIVLGAIQKMKQQRQ